MTSPVPRHLRPGVALYIGQTDNRLVDIASRRGTPVTAEAAGELERVLRRLEPTGKAATELDALAAAGLLLDTSEPIDALLLRWLEGLDRFYLDSFRHRLAPRALAAYSEVLLAHARRKRFLGQVAQCPVLPETALRRALLLGDAGEVGCKRVLCIGDDDLVSVALASLGHEVTVLDIDDYLLDLIRQSRSDVTVMHCDLASPLPAGLGPFDCFVTDPVSNRPSFELFLSRAIALLGPRARGFVAVHAPMSRLFAAIIEEMHLVVSAWWRGHNHYYSTSFAPSPYTSDWVELAVPDSRLLPVQRADAAPAKALYIEESARRQLTLFIACDGIDPRFAKPLYLDALLDTVEARVGLRLAARFVELDQEWTVMHGPTAEGYFTLHVDRAQRRLLVALRPLTSGIEEPLRNLIVAAFKQSLAAVSIALGWRTWDIRLR